MSLLLILMGLPSKEKKLYLKTTTKTIVDIDQLRKGATGRYTTDENDDNLVQHLAQRTVHFYLNQQQPVVVNDVFFTEKERSLYISMAHKMNIPVQLCWFDTKKEAFLQYISTAPTSESEEKGWLRASYIEEIFASFEFPSLDEGFEQIEYHS